MRHLGPLAIGGMFKGAPLALETVTPEMWDLVGKMIGMESIRHGEANRRQPIQKPVAARL